MSNTDETELAQMEHGIIKGDIQDYGVRKYTKYGNTMGVSLKSIIDKLFKTKVTGFKVQVIHTNDGTPRLVLDPLTTKIGISYVTEEKL